MNYSLNPNEAKKIDRTSGRINEAGKYVGKITRAEALTASTGTTGIGLSFLTDDEQSANYINLYTHKTNGETLPSLQVVNAIMACLRVKQMNIGKVQFKRWDAEAKEEYQVEADGYPDLMGKKIGLLLQKELSDNDKTGGVREQMTIYGVFDPQSELTASEILNSKTEPVVMQKMLTRLMQNPVYDRTTKKSNGQTPDAAPQPVDEFEDDIPF